MFRFNLRTYALAGILLLALSSVALGQAQSGNLYGRVSASDGTALPGVTMTLVGAATQVGTTDENGDFRFLGLPPGSYGLTAELEGYSHLDYQNVTINLGRNTSLELTLPQNLEDTITVTSESPLLDSRRISTGSTISGLELEKIPSSRDPWSILQTVPGVQMDRVNVGGNESGQQAEFIGPGSSDDEAVWAVDGVVITDMGSFGSPTYYNFDAFQEMGATTGGSDATLATGGVTINMVTKRGGNEWKGSGRFIKADDAWQSKLNLDSSEFGANQTAFSQGNRIVSVEDYGLEIGGPIIKDKLWIWGNYGVQDINLLTIADVSDATKLDTSGFKLNAQPTPSNSMVVFYNFGDKVKIGRDASPTRAQETTFNQSGPTKIYKLEDTQIVSSSFFLSGLVSYVEGGFLLAPQGGLGGKESVLDADFKWKTNFLQHETNRPQDQVKLDSSYFFETGSVGHELKFGAGYRTADLDSVTAWPGAGLRLDYNIAYGAPYNVVQLTRPKVESLGTEYTSIYAQDTLTTGNLTANIGVRYDKQEGHLNAANVPALPGFEALPDGTPLFPEATTLAQDQGFTWEDITPRLGLTYAVGSDRKTLLRASLSQFAQQLGQESTLHLSSGGYSYAYFYYDDRNGDGITQPEEIINFADGPLFSNRFDPLASQVFNQVAPGYEANLTDELTLGVEHALRPELVVGLTATVRNIDKISQEDRLVCDVPAGFSASNCDGFAVRDDVRDDYEVSYTRDLTLPDGSSLSVPIYATRDGVLDDGSFLLKNGRRSQDYLGFTLSVNKRLANRWMLRGNFTVSDWTWNVPAGSIDDPNFYLGGGYRDGDVVLEGDGVGPKGGVYVNSTWSYSLTGMYQVAPDKGWGFNVAASLNGRQGYALPYHTQEYYVFNDASYIQDAATRSEDQFRLDDIRVLDLRIEKEFNVHGVSFTLATELFNAFNESTVLQRTNRLGIGTSDNVVEVLSPRIARLSARFSF